MKSVRRCALCFHLNGDLEEKRGQLAHLNHDRSISREDNLVFLCMDHHSLRLRYIGRGSEMLVDVVTALGPEG